MATILVIDDDREICDTISAVVQRSGHDVVCANNLHDGLEMASCGDFDVVLLDVKLPDGNGLEMLPRIRKTPSCPEVIIMTGFGDADGAELAITNGAWDYLQKPSSIKEISLQITRAIQYQEEKKKRPIPVALKRDGIVGNSVVIKESLDLVAQAASGNANVLITGETGTGKELFAWAIHQNSARAEKNFVVVDCSALPETLVESVLFGHEKGAFTGADRAHEGLVSQADGGTLFLDEIGELPLNVQKAFLRVLQERRFRPVGGKKEIHSDFRLIAATNRDLDDKVKNGQFREDLLFRLRTIHIALPPLRQRQEDIKDLTHYHVANACSQYHIDAKGIPQEFLEALAKYHWPGNVRELNQALEKALASSGGNPILFPKDLPVHIRASMARKSILPGKEAENRDASPSPEMPTLEKVRASVVAQAEKKYLQELLFQSHGDIPKACAMSGLSRSRLYSLFKKHRIPLPSTRNN